MIELKVSVAMATYNHEKFIEQAIKGVLFQQTNFPFELVIGDDCSTDKTLDICLKYQLEYPDIIRVIQAKKNQGFRENNRKIWTQCQGEYIAYCEGDDFWTDPNKLQKQVDILDGNDQFMGVYHQAKIFYDDGSPARLFTPINQKETLNFDENIERWVVATCSFVFRNIFKSTKFKKYADMLLSDKIFYSDRPLMAFLSKIGDFYYIPETMGCWRQHQTNMTKIGNLAKMYEEGGEAYKKMIKLFPESKVKLSEQVIRWYLLASYRYYNKKDFKNMLRSNLISLKNIRSTLGLKHHVKCTIMILSGKEI